MKRCPSRYITPKRDKMPQTGRLLVRIVELSTAVEKVDITQVKINVYNV